MGKAYSLGLHHLEVEAPVQDGTSERSYVIGHATPKGMLHPMYLLLLSPDHSVSH